MRPYEFIRNGAVLHDLPVRIVGVGGGFDYGHNGLTHYALEDIALMRAQPGLAVIAPADADQAGDLSDLEPRVAVEQEMAEQATGVVIVAAMLAKSSPTITGRIAAGVDGKRTNARKSVFLLRMIPAYSHSVRTTIEAERQCESLQTLRNDSVFLDGTNRFWFAQPSRNR